MTIGDTLHVIEQGKDETRYRTGTIVYVGPHYITVEFKAMRPNEWDNKHPTYRASFLRVDIAFNLERRFELEGA